MKRIKTKDKESPNYKGQISPCGGRKTSVLEPPDPDYDEDEWRLEEGKGGGSMKKDI